MQRQADHALVARVRAGDGTAFAAIHAAHYAPLCRYVERYVGGRDDAEDVVSATFAHLWEERETWTIQETLHTFLRVAVRHRALDTVDRAAIRRRAAPMLMHDLTAHQDTLSADVLFQVEEVRLQLLRAIAELPPRTRRAFLLTRVEGLTYDQVALRMGISRKTVGWHVARSLAILRESVSTLAFLTFLTRLVTDVSLTHHRLVPESVNRAV